MIAANQLNNYCPYEIGDIYLTLRDENPSNRWGGTTWERIKDRFLLAAGDSYAVGRTGGEASHKLTVNEMPSHQHQLPLVANDTSEGTVAQQANFIYGKGQTAATIGQKSEYYNADVNYASEGNELAYLTAFAGGNSKTTGNDKTVQSNSSHNNMPPYLTVHMWKRIS